MGFLDLLMVAFMPPLQVLLIALLGAFLATDRINILPADARRSLNKIVFNVFTPCLMFASLAKTITLQDIISWWFMLINIGIIFIFGSILGWVIVKIFHPEKHLEGLILATCSAGNLGNLMLIIVPAVCNEEGSPFGNPSVCKPLGLSYASFSMALGGFYIWTHTYGLMKDAGAVLHNSISASIPKVPNSDLESDGTSHLLKNGSQDPLPTSTDPEHKVVQDVGGMSDGQSKGVIMLFLEKTKEMTQNMVEELLAPPTCSAIIGFVIGSVPWLKSLIIGDGAPFRVLQDTISLLGDGTIPSVTLILGGNLVKGTRKPNLGASVVTAVIIVKYVVLPAIGVAVVQGASKLGFLPSDPLFSYVLMIQFALPPAMNIGTMAELFSVGQEECSVLFLWTYLVAAVALTVWSTVYMWILA